MSRTGGGVGMLDEEIRSAVEHAPVGIGLLRGGRVLLANAELRRLLEMSTGQTDPAHVSELPSTEVGEAILRALASPQPEGHLESVAGPGEGRCAVSVRTLDAALQAVWVGPDVPEWKRLQGELRVHREWLNSFFKAAPVGLCILDDELRYLQINEELARMNGRQASEHVGKTVREMIPKAAEAIEPLLRKVAGGESVLGLEVAEETPASPGERNHKVLNYFPVPLDDGGRTGIGAVVMDVNELKRAEQERRLLEVKLHHSQKLEAVGQLAGGVAHDFNNILTAIMGNVDLLMRDLSAFGALDSSAEGNLADIRHFAERAAALTKQLLAFSRAQSLEPVLLNLNDVISSSERLLAPAVGDDVVLRIERADALPAVLADPTQMEQVLLNLGVNARDAMPNGGELVVRTSVLDTDEQYLRHNPDATAGRYVCLSVIDNGVGMDADTQQRIFDPFFTTKPSGQGTGLGLATVHGIARQSEGHLRVESELGKGTALHVLLPVADGIPSRTSKRASPVRTGSETIVLCEDDTSVRRVMQSTLEAAGYRVLTAATGADALELAGASDPVELLVTDVAMPKMGGTELAERFRKAHPKTRVLFISGHGAEKLANRSETAPTPFLAKPFDSAALLRKIRSVLDDPS